MHLGLTSLKSLLTLVLVLLRPITKPGNFRRLPMFRSLSCPILVGHPEKVLLVAFESTRPESTSLGNSGGMLCCDLAVPISQGFTMSNVRRLPRC